MVRHLGQRSVSVPPGFATTADAYWRYVDANGLRQMIAAALHDLEEGKASLAETGQALRRAIAHGDWPADMADAIRVAYRELGKRISKPDPDG